MAVEGGYTAEPIIEVAFGQGPYDEVLDGEWVDISEHGFSATVTRGRASEFDQFPAGTATVGLRSDGREFDVFNAAGPYAGLLEANVPLRILARVPDAISPYLDDFLAAPSIEPWWEVLRGTADASSGNGAVLEPDSDDLFTMYGHVGVLSRGLTMTLEVTNVSDNFLLYLQRDTPVATLATGFSIGNGLLAFVGGGLTQGSIAYNATTHRWLRVVWEGSTDVVWLTSPDGTTWTERNREVGLDVPSTFGRIIVSVDTEGESANLRHVELSTTVVPLYRGVVDGWPSTYLEGGRFSDVEVPSTDVFKTLAERPMPDTYRLFLESFSTLGPEEWYRLDNTDGGVVRDVYGRRSGYVYTTLSEESSGECYVSEGSLTVPSLEPEFGIWPKAIEWPVSSSDFNDTPLRNVTWSFSLWIRVADRGTLGIGNFMFLLEQRTGASETAAGFTIISLRLEVATGELVFLVDTPGGQIQCIMFQAALTSIGAFVDLADGAAHQITCVRNTTQGLLYVDGRLIVSNTVGGATSWYSPAGGSTYLARNPGLSGPDGTLKYPAWSVDELIFFDQALNAVDVLELYEHQVTGWHGVIPTGEAITAVLDLVGWPDELRAIDQGTTLVQSLANPQGIRVLDYLQSIAATEQGRLFVDAMGRVVFHERGRELWEPHQVDVQYTFTDENRDAGWTDVGTRDGSLMVRLDDRHLYDAARVQRVGGEPQEVKLTTDPVRTFDLSGLLLNEDLQALNLAEWITFRYGTPQPRSEAWEVDPEVLPEHWGRLVGLEIGHRIEHSITPGGVGSALELAQHVEVIQHSIDTETWTMTLNGVPVDDTAYLLWAPEDVASTSDPNGWGDTDGTPPGGAWG